MAISVTDGCDGFWCGISVMSSRIANEESEASSPMLKPGFVLLSPSAPVSRIDDNAKVRSSCGLKTTTNLWGEWRREPEQERERIEHMYRPKECG